MGLSGLEWDFGGVPDEELTACCYWEYARESKFIREVRQRCCERDRKDGLPGGMLHSDLQRIQSIGHAANFFLHGFFCPPDGVLPDRPPLRFGAVHRLTGSFPRPWQTLTKPERKYRAFVPPRGNVGCMGIVPFERGLSLEAKEIVETVAARRRLRDAHNAQVRRENPELSEEALAQMDKLQFPDIRPSVIYESGTECTVVRISWGVFTNEEIVQMFRKWVKANRPVDVPGPDDKGRNKARDWRVALERLGMMRLLHHFRLRELPTGCPQAWKLYRRREWYKERKRAGERFRSLFPFLASSDRPLCWGTKGGRSKWG